MTVKFPGLPSLPAAVARKGAISAVLLAALTSPLEHLEGNIKQVYANHLAGGIQPTAPDARTPPQSSAPN